MSLPLAIVDYRLPKEAVSRLQEFANIHLFNAKGLTFDAVDGHPDIFVFQIDNQLVIARNTPQSCINALNKYAISFQYGQREVGFDVASSTAYNCLVTKDLIFHKKDATDGVISELCGNKQLINLPQPFARCSIFSFGDNHFITSDKGIHKVLEANKLSSCFINPSDILLPPYKNGFIGGCLGVYNKTVFLSGSISYLKDGILLKSFVESNGYQLIELYNGAVLDVGGIFFCK